MILKILLEKMLNGVEEKFKEVTFINNSLIFFVVTVQKGNPAKRRHQGIHLHV